MAVRRVVALAASLLSSVGAGTAAAGEHHFVRAGDAARAACATAGPGWQRADFDDRAWAPRVMTVRDPNAHRAVVVDEDEPFPAEPKPARPPPDCLGSRFARWHFSLAEVPRLGTITLHIKYTHGFAAYLNGVELARRRLDADAPNDALAVDVHGTEAERLIVPVAAGLLHRGDNVLAVEVHPHTANKESQVEVALSGDEGPRIVRGPYLLDVRPSAVTVVFDTDVPTAGSVTVNDAAGERTRSDAVGTHHVLRFEGLKAGNVYHYRARATAATASREGKPRQYADARGTIIGGDWSAAPSHGATAQSNDASAQLNGAPSNDAAAQFPADGGAATSAIADDAADSTVADAGDAAFHTPPDRGRPLRFAVYGDVRSGHDIHATLNRALADDEPDFAILTGDLVDRGTDEGEWESFFDIAGPLLRQLPIFPAIGNHEYARAGKGAAAFMQFFRFPVAGESEPTWYSFDIGAAHFVALDSNQYKTARQLAWLDRDLKEARKRGQRALFVYAHEPPFSSGIHGDNSIAIRDYVPVFERYRVSMFFGGHDHDFERGRVDTFDYVITGGGGAELRNARCGVPGKKSCPPRVLAFANDHNYVMVELLPSLFRVCPKRVDGTPLEACSVYPLR